MTGYGNGNPEVCANNLLKTVRFEVPFERIKGIDGSLIDKPNAEARVGADATWLIETYEPRVKINSVSVKASNGADREVTADITVNFKEET